MCVPKWVVLFLFELLVAGSVSASSQAGEMDFTSTRVGDVVRREIAVTNESEVALGVREVSSSCSCLRVLGTPRTIAPREAGKIVVEYRPVKGGHTDVELLVETDRKTDAVIAFRWVGEVLPAQPGEGTRGTPALADLFINASDLAPLLEQGAVMLVDVRSSDKFNLCHIDGALNWPWSMLTRAAIKTRQLVVTGLGSDDDALARESLGLRQSGFTSVRVLRGGVRAWVAAKRSVRGTSVGGARMAVIEPAEFFASSQDDWLVVELENAAVPSQHFPGGIVLKADLENQSQFAAEIERQLQLRSHAAKVLIVSTAGEKYEVIERQLPGHLALPIFYLNRGARGYREFVAQMGALRDRREMKLVARGRGDSQGGSVVPRGEGCETCPKTSERK